MKWTNEIPTVAGWYWFRQYTTWPAKPELVVLNEDGELEQNHWSLKYYRLVHRECQWAGPIEYPTEQVQI